MTRISVNLIWKKNWRFSLRIATSKNDVSPDVGCVGTFVTSQFAMRHGFSPNQTRVNKIVIVPIPKKLSAFVIYVR